MHSTYTLTFKNAIQVFFLVSESLTNAIYVFLLTYSISSKHVFIAVSDFDARKNHLKPDNSGSIFKGQITTPGKALQIKFPTSLAKKLVKCPGFVSGRDVEVSI